MKNDVSLVRKIYPYPDFTHHSISMVVVPVFS